MKTNIVISVLMALIMALNLLPSFAAEETIDLTALYKSRDADASWSAADVTAIDLNALQQESTYLIDQAGDYVLSGSWNGQIVVEVAEDAKVRLILNGVSITSSEGPAIYEKQADKLIITLAEGSVNTLTDGPAIVDGDDTIGAALYAEDDLSINGTGTLNATGTAKHGIQSKADLIIAGGQLNVTSALDGIRGRNSVLVLDGNISITAQGDGITATRTDREDKGWIILANGTVSITTGSGAGTPKASANSKGSGRGGWGRGGMQQAASSSSSISQKAVKAASDLTVFDGQYTFNTADDGLHGVNVTVSGGSFSIQTGDDGMHADQTMTINGSSIAITQCYEGIEGTDVTISGGDIHVVASDDGINASGGQSASGFGGRGMSAGSGMPTVSGGHLEVTSGGDGLDSNGSLTITGGVVGIWAASAMHEGPIDFNGTGSISGGLVIIASTGGMMSDMASLSGAQLYSVPISSNYSAGSVIVVNANGTEASFEPQSAFSSLIVAGAIGQGQSLNVQVNGSQLFQGTVTADMANSGGMTGYGRGFGNMGFGNTGFYGENSGGGFQGGRGRRGR